MAYTITLTNGTVLTTIANATVDTTTSLTLLGRNYAGYGGFVAEDFVYLLENFANTSAVTSPLTGQLWYNTTLSRLQLWNGSAWIDVGGSSGGVTIEETTVDETGLLFYDPLAPTNSKYYRFRVRDDGLYAGHFVLESLNDDLTLNTVIINTDNVGTLELAGGITIDGTLDIIGTGTAPTPPADDSSTKIATTAFVHSNIRIKSTSPHTFYVDSVSGDDSNDGFTSLTAFATLQKAWDTMAGNYDMNGFDAYITVADGTYVNGAEVAVLNANVQPPNCPLVHITGNSSSPPSCLISATDGIGVAINATVAVNLDGFKIVATGTQSAYSPAGTGIVCSGYAGIANINFGACNTNHMTAASGGNISTGGSPYTISGGSGAHWFAQFSGTITTVSSTIGLVGTPAFSDAFANAQFGGVLIVYGTIFVGSATGVRYYAVAGSGISTNGGGASFIPGDAPGDSSTGYYF